MPCQSANVTTTDGTCGVHVCTPSGTGPWPGVILYMDAGGIRPAAVAMAQHVADAGYSVLLPDLFYRYGPYGPLVPSDVFAGDVRAILGPLLATTGIEKAVADTATFLAYLHSRPDVEAGTVRAVGFCMGGGMAIAAAGAYPDRFAAVASFHGGNLATDEPTSPHRFAPRIKARLYIAAATGDDSYPPAMAATFEGALTDAGVRYTARTYSAAHGWMVPDFPVYDRNAAEDGWRDVFSFFARTS